MQVKFTCVINKHNKPVAIDLKSGGGGGGGGMAAAMGGNKGGMNPWMGKGKMGGGMCCVPMMGMHPMMMKGMHPMMMDGGMSQMMMGKGMNPMMMGKGMYPGMMQNQWQEDKMAKGKGGGQFKIDKSGGELGEVTGKIKSYNENRFFGFIISEEVQEQGFTDDIFVHGEMMKNYKPGQTVRFTCVINKAQKPVAINLRSGLK